MRERERRRRGGPPGQRRDIPGHGEWTREVQRLIEADAAALLREQSERQRLALQRWGKAHELFRDVDALFQATVRAAHGLFHYIPPVLEDPNRPVRLVLLWRGAPPERDLTVQISPQRGSVEWGVAVVEEASPQLTRRDVLTFSAEHLKDAIRKLIDHSQWADAIVDADTPSGIALLPSLPTE
jgi:hypothetical protein